MILFSEAAHHWMQEAIDCALRPKQPPHPNPRVGCVIVKEGECVGRGWHEQAGYPHAEIMALAQAGKEAQGARVYTTLEPCAHQGRTPACVEALIKAQVHTVISAMRDPNPMVQGAGFAALKAAGIEVQVGLLAKQAQDLNRGFIARQVWQRPWVVAKVGMSLDGRIALSSGASQWITCERARMDVQQWRAQSDVILTGIGTVLRDDPRLSLRDPTLLDFRPPLRVVVDSQGRTPLKAALLQQPGETWIVHTPSINVSPIKLDRVSYVSCAANSEGQVALGALLARLGEHYNQVLVEAGPRLLSSLWREQLIDEWVLYLAPKFLGASALAVLDTELQFLTEALSLHWQSVVLVGDCLRLVLTVDRGEHDL